MAPFLIYLLVHSCLLRPVFNDTLPFMALFRVHLGVPFRTGATVFGIHAQIPPIYAHQIFSDSDMLFLNGSHFDTFL